MAGTLAREHTRARHMTRKSTEEYLRDLGEDAALLEAASICLDAGLTPAELAVDPEVAAKMTELVAAP